MVHGRLRNVAVVHAFGEPIFKVLCCQLRLDVFWIQVLHVQAGGDVVFWEHFFQLCITHEVEVGVIGVERLWTAVVTPLGDGGEELEESLDDSSSDTKILGVIVAVGVLSAQNDEVVS